MSLYKTINIDVVAPFLRSHPNHSTATAIIEEEYIVIRSAVMAEILSHHDLFTAKQSYIIEGLLSGKSKIQIARELSVAPIYIVTGKQIGRAHV